MGVGKGMNDQHNTRGKMWSLMGVLWWVAVVTGVHGAIAATPEVTAPEAAMPAAAGNAPVVVPQRDELKDLQARLVKVERERDEAVSRLDEARVDAEAARQGQAAAPAMRVRIHRQ